MITAWLIESYARVDGAPLYWEGFGWTHDANAAVRFARERDAAKIIARLELGGRGRPVEHAWMSADAPRERRYGDDKTIHRTGYVDVETDKRGAVVGAWFRCAMLPFRQAPVTQERAADLSRAYAVAPPRIKAIVFEEDR